MLILLWKKKKDDVQWIVFDIFRKFELVHAYIISGLVTNQHSHRIVF